MKKGKTHINFENDTVMMLGEVQDVILTSSGHYALPLNNKQQILDKVVRKGDCITLHIQHDPSDKLKTAHKLHCQFSHPHSNKHIDLIKRAEMGNDNELIRHMAHKGSFTFMQNLQRVQTSRVTNGIRV